MFVLKSKGKGKYVAAYNHHHAQSNTTFTTNINEARTFVNLDDLDSQFYVLEYDPEKREWIRFFSSDFDIIQVTIAEKKVYTNLRRK